MVDGALSDMRMQALSRPGYSRWVPGQGTRALKANL